MARRNSALEIRLITASLWRRRGTAALAVLAVAIGGSVAAALLHLSADVERKLSRELRALGPNLLVVPENRDGAGVTADDYLDAGEARRRLAAAGVPVACLLYVSARVAEGTRTIEVPVIGADLDEARRLHPAWRVGAGDAHTLVGARLRARWRPAGSAVTLRCGDRELAIVPGATLEAGGPDDDALWIPLADAQKLAGLPGLASLAEARVPGINEGGFLAMRIEREGGMRVMLLHALSQTEAGLLERMRRLMTLVTVAAFLAAGLCAFGTLTDLALERRREIALLKSLGASDADVVRLFVAESLTLGALGGVLGWLIGVVFAEFIGGAVFHSAIALRPDVPLVVIALSMVVAGIAGLGPIGLALAVEPAAALKGD